MNPKDLKYTREHEWVRVEGDTCTLGITDHAQEALGDVVYVELPEAGDRFDAGEAFGSVESVKAVSDCYLPAAGEIREVNGALADSPETVNKDPFGQGWMIKFAPEDPGALEALMDANAYEAFLQEEANKG